MSFPNAAAFDRLTTLTPARVALGLVAFTSLLHLLAAGGVAFSVDEAHYALYGLFPDWSYFDHPPLIGWLQALVLFFSDSELALRLWPILMAAVASLVLYRLVQRLFPNDLPWLPVIAVAALQSAVVFQLVSFAMVPEDPLLLFGLVAMVLFRRVLDSDRLRDWIWLGLALGLAGLAKYTAVVLVLGMFLVLVFEKRLALLRRPGPWIGALVALTLVAPVFWWNWQHDWISFAYQWGHGAPGRTWSAVRALRSGAGQVLAFGGLVVFGTLSLLAAMREWRAEPAVRFLALFAAPALGIFAWSAGFQETLPHWTLLGWATASPLAARWTMQRWNRRSVRIGVRMAAAYSAILVVAIHAQFIRPWLPFSPFAHPMADLYGWREAGERARALSTELGLPLMVGNWTHASRIAWYARSPVQVIDRRVDQFDLWFGTPAPSSNGLIVLPEKNLRSRDNGLDRFADCKERDELTTFLGEQPVHTFFFFECRDYRGLS